MTFLFFVLFFKYSSDGICIIVVVNFGRHSIQTDEREALNVAKGQFLN